MIRLIQLMSIFIFISCGMVEPPHVVQREDPYFKESDSYFDSYKNDFSYNYYLYTGKDISTNIPVNFSEEIFFKDNPNSIGVCFSRGSKGIEILIKKSHWKNLSRSCRKTLMYHEFGHCLLNQDHRDSYPSIMNSNNKHCDLMSSHKNNFFEEFYLRTRDSIIYLRSLF
jgi:hypothetical protein